jgi:glucosamine-6-phosphate deaminase
MNCWNTGVPEHITNLSEIFTDNKVDLSLRTRSLLNEKELYAYQALLAADQYAMEYEQKIKNLGGIGFFLGGIGPDGHIGFNIKGSDHFSTTRIISINYETAASAAVDLGGIELSRQKTVMTIGLNTITANPTTTAIIIAAGISKAGVIRDAIEKNPSILYPATVLQKLSGSSFYLTAGAASLLQTRQYETLKKNILITKEEREKIIIDISYNSKISLENLSFKNISQDYFGSLLTKDLTNNLNNSSEKFPDALIIREKIITNIINGLLQLSNLRFLHTAPHHDDIMLGYLPYVIHLRDPSNTHHFATMTSGFTSVTNKYIYEYLLIAQDFLQEFKNLNLKQGTLDEYNQDIYEYLNSVASQSPYHQKKIQSKRFIRNILKFYNTQDISQLSYKIEALKNYCANSYPGKKDEPEIQNLKGMIREWEEELWWGHLGFDCRHTFHLRLGFYTGDIFTPSLNFIRDIKPIINLIEKTTPDIITVALDPESSGPDTHYKVLQVVSEALRHYSNTYPNRKITVWGYRNIWNRFHPSDANIFVPVSMNSLAILKSAFLTCFGSQRAASFPSHEYDGPFSDLAQKIMVDQYNLISTILGKDFFYTSKSARLRAAHGFCFLKAMTSNEFFSYSQDLKRQMEVAQRFF